MDRSELTYAIAAVLLAAMALGALLTVVVGRLSGRAASRARLRAAEARIATLEADLTDARARIDELTAASEAILRERGLP